MSTVNGQPRLTVADLVTRCRGQFISLTNTFSYFCTPPMAEEDLRQYLHDPIAALSPLICGDLGTVGLALVPYLEKGNGRAGDTVTFEKPAEGRQLTSARAEAGGMTILMLATKEEAAYSSRARPLRGPTGAAPLAASRSRQPPGGGRVGDRLEHEVARTGRRPTRVCTTAPDRLRRHRSATARTYPGWPVTSRGSGRIPTHPIRERKRMARLLLEDVTLTKTKDITLGVRFKGGATTVLTIPRPPASTSSTNSAPRSSRKSTACWTATPPMKSRSSSTNEVCAQATATPLTPRASSTSRAAMVSRVVNNGCERPVY